MKKFGKALLPCIAAGLLILGGCANAAGNAGTTSAAKETAVQTAAETTAQAAQAAEQAGAETEAENTTETTISDVTAVSEEITESEWFSNRDLAGTWDASEAETIKLDGDTVTITEEGVYILSGEIADGQIIVEVDKTEKVQLVLDGVDISSSDSAAIYIKSADKVFITLADGSSNYLESAGEFASDENNVDSVIFSKDDLTINGTGHLEITTDYGHAIVSKDDLTITGGIIDIECSSSAITANDVLAIANADISIVTDTDAIKADNEDTSLGTVYIESGTFSIIAGDDGIKATGQLIIAGGDFTLDCVGDAIHSDSDVEIDGGTFIITTDDDGIHADGMVTINGGDIDITGWEGIEGTYVLINDGNITVDAQDDGINATNKSSAYETAIEINGGYIKVTMASGDTDGIDSNGNLYINGGTVDVTCQSPFDYDGRAEYNGGTLIVNGQETDSITNQMMGGPGGMGGFGGPGGRR